jgi:hypothetical protein
MARTHLGTLLMYLPATYLTMAGFTVEDASSDLLAELLDAYDFELKARAAPVWEALLPGLSRGEIEDRLGQAGVEPPEELIVWWTWHNGLRPGVPNALRRPQMSLEFSLALRADDDLGLEPHQWDPAYIRVAGEGAKSSIAVSCATPVPPPLVRSVAWEFGGTQGAGIHRQVISLCTPVTWWLLALSKGWTTFDPSDITWDIDDDAFPYEWRLTAMTQ